MYRNKIIILISFLIALLILNACSTNTTSQTNGIQKEMYNDMLGIYNMLYSRVTNIDLEDTKKLQEDTKKYELIMTRYNPKNISLNEKELDLYNNITELSLYQFEYETSFHFNEKEKQEEYLNKFMKKYNELKIIFNN